MRMEGNYYPRFTGENKAQERFYLAQCHIHWIIEKAREFQRNIYFCFVDYAKAFDCVDTNIEKFFKRWEYQTILLLPVKPVCRSRNDI